jgi:Undecaprenyl-phosphate galactose phosphotransferase WbaP
MLALELRVGLLDPANRIAKRALDLAGVLVGAVVLVPLTALLALAIRLDSPGPALYRQERIGFGGRHFRVWKFRTMVTGADGVLADLLARDPGAAEEWARHHKLARDPRVTRVGRWLRRTSLDELPQLWNVLRGEMSLVGPRPIVDEEVAHYGEAFELFSAVRPGISGYWQVSGRSRVPYPERVEYDTYYVRNWSIWLDAVILARTVDVVLRREGAY